MIHFSVQLLFCVMVAVDLTGALRFMLWNKWESADNIAQLDVPVLLLSGNHCPVCSIIRFALSKAKRLYQTANFLCPISNTSLKYNGDLNYKNCPTSYPLYVCFPNY